MENNEQPKSKVQELIDIAFNNSIEAAMAAAKETKNEALVDEFQKELAKLHDELVKRGKIPPTP